MIDAVTRVKLNVSVCPEVFEIRVRAHEAVVGMWALSGDDDYELRLVCAGLTELNTELRILRSLGETRTSLLLRDVLADTPTPQALTKELDDAFGSGDDGSRGMAGHCARFGRW